MLTSLPYSEVYLLQCASYAEVCTLTNAFDGF